MKQRVLFPFLFLLLMMGVLSACTEQAASPAPQPVTETAPVEVLPTQPQAAPPAAAPAQPAEVSEATQPQPPAPSALDGKALAESRCVQCHSYARVESAKKTADQWKASVERMVSKGAVLNAEEQQAVIQYLAETFK